MSENQRQQPTERQLKTLRKIARLEIGAIIFINTGDAEECENCGWAEARPAGGYKLTDEGRSLLAEVNSN